jgi:hypothetical protein
VEGMGAHRQAEEVQKWGCWAVCNLTSSTPANQARAAEAGAIEAVVEGMGAHRQAEKVQDYGCWALSQFSQQADLAMRMALAGADECVRSAMQAANAMSETKSRAQEILAKLVVPPVECRAGDRLRVTACEQRARNASINRILISGMIDLLGETGEVLEVTPIAVKLRHDVRGAACAHWWGHGALQQSAAEVDAMKVSRQWRTRGGAVLGGPAPVMCL